MADSLPDSSIFSVRIVSIDHYMAPPIPGVDICYSSFQGGNVNEVPVIRIYGSTPAGQKTCLHVHQALPYLYVPFVDLLPQDSQSRPNQDDGALVDALALALDKALKLKSTAGSKRQHVHGCSVVRAKKFYGYHSSEELFVKINLYYPHDVSRAADLLLEGAVFDKSLQPHESHIPFILQFLVDYNLYGMGHVHLSKMKFRPPVPAVYSSRKLNDTGLYMQEMDDTASKSPDVQADSSPDPSLSSPVWISPKIPGDWIWNNSSEFNEPSDQDTFHVKRQSVCELEGDAIVDDVINQQLKTYFSLSQNCSDAKMVQSLIPIWQEEYERTGIHEELLCPDPHKPSPEDVLRTLIAGIGLEDRLKDLCSEAKEIFDLNDQALGTSTEERKLTEPSRGSFNDKCQDFLDSVSEHALPCRKVVDSSPSEPKDASPIQSPEIVVPSDPKARDAEVLGLLRWLATTQAAEEINSDDELVRETILTPLLPATTIDKVLEKAGMDLDSESQKECQDILDSIEDLVDPENQEEDTSCLDADQTETSLDRIIPQTDGSSDDPFLTATSSAENSPTKEVKSECKRSSKPQVQKDTSSPESIKRKRNDGLWGSLPFSLSKSVTGDSNTTNIQTSNKCGNETKGLRTSSSTKYGPRNLYDSLIDIPTNFLDKKVEATLAGCSVRDLMRKKRSHRTESAGCDSMETENAHLKEEKKKDICFYPKRLDFYGIHEDCDKQVADSPNYRPLACEKREVNGTVAPESTCSGSLYGTAAPLSDIEEMLRTSKSSLELEENVKSTLYSKRQDSEIFTGHMGTSNSTVTSFAATSSDPKSVVNERWKHINSSVLGCLTDLPTRHNKLNRDADIQNFNYEGTDFGPSHKLVGTDAVLDVQCEDFCGSEREGNHNLSKPGCSATKISNIGETASEFGGLTCKKLQKSDWNDVAFESPSLSPATAKPVAEQGNPNGASGDCHGEGEVEDKHLGNENSSHLQQPSGQIPTYYQNNGSFFYVLKPVQSPPSADSVNRWLLCGNGGSFEEINKVPVEPSLKDMIASETLSPNYSSMDTELGVEYVARPIVDQSHNEKDGFFSGESKLFSDDVTAVLPNEERIAKLHPRCDTSQDMSQISGPDGKSKPTPLSQTGFRDPASVGAGQQLALLSIEVHAESRGDLRPNPRFDAVNIIALALQNDNGSTIEVHVLLYSKNEPCSRNLDGILACKVSLFLEEKELFGHFMKILHSLDPDILMGWDIQGGSLGFLAERAAHLGIGLLNQISRAPSENKISAGDLGKSDKGLCDDLLPDPLNVDSVALEDAVVEDEWGRTHASGVHVGGRIVLNVWRLMRNEVKLNLYSFEAVAESVLRRKVPSIPYKVLTRWFSSGVRARYRCIEYVAERAKLNLDIMNQLDMINRTSELARVFGIDFFSVLSRGSQYRVESMLLRLAHTQNYLAISPGKQQVASQPAMECIPLVMEPESGFYADPVIVLDFQSLYPSMIIGYNLCFCTCLGKIAPYKAADILGVSPYTQEPDVMRNLKDEMLLTPNGVLYVPSKVRKGVLPRLLEEILSTRIMVKKAMKKLNSSHKVLHRIFNARQLALKLIANVTYGYTAAGFSGRMPCAELADSIVQCGRSTLEKAITLVNTNEKWKAKVIYGDTDSLFVLLNGRSVKEAFQIGQEIASAVTAMNPYPVTLKMEKVYQPCFLLTKKRYVGYSYESPDQEVPVFDAKGIETVRRDTCAAVAKTMEQSLRTFFEHQDIRKVKEYLQRQWKRILSGRVSIQDFIFAKEVRLGTYSTRAGSSLPPGAIVATKAMKADPRAEPRYAERVPYVVIHGEPGARLVDMVVDPYELLALDSPYRLNDTYYISKQIIPALQRVFGLLGVDLNQWFSEMPRPARETFGKRNIKGLNMNKTRIDYYYLSKHCVLCGELVQASAHLCSNCSSSKTAAAIAITERTSKIEKEMQHLAAICRHCGGGDWVIESGVKCVSLACSVFYERRKVQKELQGLSAVATDTGFYPKCMVEWF